MYSYKKQFSATRSVNGLNCFRVRLSFWSQQPLIIREQPGLYSSLSDDDSLQGSGHRVTRVLGVFGHRPGPADPVHHVAPNPEPVCELGSLTFSSSSDVAEAGLVSPDGGGEEDHRERHQSAADGGDQGDGVFAVS